MVKRDIYDITEPKQKKYNAWQDCKCLTSYTESYEEKHTQLSEDGEIQYSTVQLVQYNLLLWFSIQLRGC